MIPKPGRLARRLTIIFILIAILPLLAGSILSIKSVFDFGIGEIASHQKSIISLGKTYIYNHVDNIFTNLYVMGEFTSQKSENIDISLRAMCVSSPNLYAELTLTDPEGNQLSHLINCEPVRQDKLVNIAESEAFLLAKKEKLFVGTVTFIENKPLVTMSCMVKVKTGKDLIVIAVVNYQNIWESLSLLQPGNGGYFYIVDRQGDLIGYKDIDLVTQRRNLISLPPVYSVIKKNQGAISKRYVGLLGIEVIGTSSLVKNANWAIVIEQPVDKALAAPKGLITNLSLLIGVVSLFASMAAIMLAQYMVRPINLLAQGAEAIAQGNLSHRIAISSKNEIGILARTFNQMTHQLSISRERLEEYNRTLELRVERRTEELRKSQQKLSLLFEQTPLAVIEWNTNFQVTAWNPAAEEIFGYSKQEVMGNNIIELIFPEIDRENIRQVWHQLLVTRESIPCTNQNITKDNKIIICEWYNTPLIDKSSNVIVVASMALDITDRKEAEEALRTSKEYLRLIIDNIPQQIFWKDPNLVFLGCNTNWAKYAQLESPQVVVGKTDYDLIANREVAESFRAQDRLIIESGKPQLHMIAVKQKPSSDGHKIWLDISKIPLYDSTGKAIGLLGVLEDITERKNTEAILQRQAAVIEAALDGIALLNTEGILIYANQAFADIHCYQNPSELIGKNWQSLYLDSAVEAVVQKYENQILPALFQEGKWRGEEILTRYDGSICYLEVLHYLLESGEQVCIVRDITDRKLAAETLREREEQYHSIFEATTDGLIINNFAGYVVEANPAAYKMYGYEYQDFIGLHATKFIHPEDHQRAAADLQNLLENSGHFSTEGIHVRKDGSVFPVEVHAMGFIYRGQPHMMSVIRDITERKQAEEALHAEKEKSERLLLNILPSAIAHRLKEDQGYIADSFPAVTVLFADIVGFTVLSTRLSPTELVEMLNRIFSEFDRLAEKHNLEKIKTIGDAYMVVGGLPTPHIEHAEAIANMALDMQTEIEQFNNSTGEIFSIRIGIHSGPVVAGVIGIKKFIYDLWGDTVNTASRMESHGIPGCIQVSQATYELLQDKYLFEERGSISVKGKGVMSTYLLLGKKNITT